MSKTPKPSKVNFRGDGWDAPGDGTMPLVELNQAILSPCIRCGRSPQEVSDGLVLNMRQVGDVLHADALCVDCMTDDERADYEQLVEDDEAE